MNMVPVPLPTDNLYKFMALAGVALFVLSFIYPARKTEELELLLVETDTRVNVYTISRDAYEADRKRLESDPRADESKFAELSQRRLDGLVAREKLKGDVAREKLLAKQLRTQTHLAFGLMLAGLVLSTGGFGLWYVHIQRPADMLAARALAAKDA